MSKLYVDEVVKRDGNPAYDLAITGKNAQTIISGITWHTSYNSTTQDLGSLNSYITSSTVAVRILHQYSHNGAANHGYLAGFLFQKGTTYSATGGFTNQTHYNWYYNVTTTPVIIPWNPSGNATLSMYVSNAYNSSASNTHDFLIDAIYEQ